MDNQHKLIKGYRDLTAAEIALLNEVKAQGEQLAATVAKLRACPAIDQRAVSIGATELQPGVMWLVRAIAQPTTF